MSRFGGEWDGDEWYPNQAALWWANVERSLAGKRGKRALAKLREALLALPEKRLIAGALSTYRLPGEIAEEREKHPQSYWIGDAEETLEREGTGVCAIGAFLWHKKVEAGADPDEAFAQLPTLIHDDEEGGLGTASLGKQAGLTFTLAYHLAYYNDEKFSDMTPEERYTAFLTHLDKQLAEPVAVAVAA